MRSSYSLLAVATLLLAPFSLTVASQVRPLNLEQMNQRAARVFWGRCVEVERGSVTEVRFEVIRAGRGVNGSEVVVRMVGNVSGLPVFEPGEEVVLFLYGESSRGLSSPIGFKQGNFRVFRDKNGASHAINAYGNQRLFDGLTSEAGERLDGVDPDWRGRRELAPDVLIDMSVALGTP